MTYDASNRREIIYGHSRARLIRWICLAILIQAAFFAVWAIFLLVKFRNNQDTGVEHVRSFLTMFVLPVTLAEVALGTLALRVAPRRNATLRLLATFLGGLLVFEAVSTGPLIGTLLTPIGLVLVGLALWPDKNADGGPADSDKEPGQGTGA